MLKAGFLEYPNFPNEDIELYFRNEKYVYGQLCYLLLEVLNSPYQIFLSNSGGVLLENGTWTGLIGMLNRSEIDLAMANFFMSDERNEAVHFAYPFNLDDLAFITRKPQYSPHMLAIFSTVSATTWIVLAVTILLLIFIYLLLTNTKYSFDIVILNILAVCLNQPIVIKPSTLSEKCIIYSWRIGMMFFIFSYNSVLLSFLTIPPLVGVSNVEELAKAIQNGEYHCMIQQTTSLPALFAQSEKESLRIIGDNFLQNPRYGSPEDFFLLRKEKVAYIDNREELEFVKGKYFISSDRFMQFSQAMATTKDFCCKEQLDMAILRLQAGGFLPKIFRERNFRIAMEVFSSESLKLDNRRRITLIDISAAFVFLISGYCISFIALLAELKLSPRSKMNFDENMLKN